MPRLSVDTRRNSQIFTSLPHFCFPWMLSLTSRTGWLVNSKRRFESVNWTSESVQERRGGWEQEGELAVPYLISLLAVNRVKTVKREAREEAGLTAGREGPSTPKTQNGLLCATEKGKRHYIPSPLPWFSMRHYTSLPAHSPIPLQCLLPLSGLYL